ncbi:MAG: acyl phosphate:glycerol-3-phosphate acyltransferase [Gaiellales bacterium]|jgi:glycerol-3-phosphate acyltransferase PlsY|nr:acyl phosphate:glycerol-3-phosphate acyltransferase [Gaiellales bacterium]
MNTLLAVVIAYLLGSCAFGYWAGRLRGVDLRHEGSGNTGGTNAVRVLGAKVGVPVIALDIFKGTVAVVIGGQLGGTGTEVLSAAAAVLGHTFPVFLRFRGGKAVATGAGAMLGLAPLIAVGVFLLWIAIGLVTRYVSVASMISAVAFMLATVLTGKPWPVIAFTVFASAVVFWRHRGNLARLRAGTENRINLPAVRR